MLRRDLAFLRFLQPIRDESFREVLDFPVFNLCNSQELQRGYDLVYDAARR